MIIALDGPAASGKSTTAKLAGKKLGYLYIDTGAMYRSMALLCYKEGVDYTDKERVISLIPKAKIEQTIDDKGGKTKTFLNSIDVSEDIRTPEITRGVTPVCEISEVRRYLVALQREMGEKGNVILDGRDIGTVVFPNADFKFWMDADVDVRAKRRYEEMTAKGINVTLDEVREDLIRRDERDASRSDSPMVRASDAIIIDTTKLSINEQVDFIVSVVMKGK